ncbi:Protein yceI precursor [hydrothermal vent metagenome]|uniref:Protein yceI n=1 Tax=hydrothermal vent metagenome TaxID=652676 RepID=A0A3B0QVJ8_9ZZZZ
MKRRYITIFILLAGFLMATCLTTLTPQTARAEAKSKAEHYVIDTKKAHAFINFRISHLGYSWLHGRFNKFEGEFDFDKANPSNSKITVRIDPASVDTNHAERNKHIRGKDFFNVKKFPKSGFVSSSITRVGKNAYVVKGKFTLHGVTKDIIIRGEDVGAGKDPWGGYRRGFRGHTTLKLHDYGITYDLGPASTIVHLEFSIEGIRQ